MPRKPKHTLTDLIAALERVRHDEVAAWCVEWHIKQRTASKGNPGRPKREKDEKTGTS